MPRRYRPGDRTALQEWKTQEGDSWRHEKITLKPLNPDFEPIALTGADEGELRMIAELVDVLGG